LLIAANEHLSLFVEMQQGLSVHGKSTTALKFNEITASYFWFSSA